MLIRRHCIAQIRSGLVIQLHRKLHVFSEARQSHVDVHHQQELFFWSGQRGQRAVCTAIIDQRYNVTVCVCFARVWMQHLSYQSWIGHKTFRPVAGMCHVFLLGTLSPMVFFWLCTSSKLYRRRSIVNLFLFAKLLIIFSHLAPLNLLQNPWNHLSSRLCTDHFITKTVMTSGDKKSTKNLMVNRWIVVNWFPGIGLYVILVHYLSCKFRMHASFV